MSERGQKLHAFLAACGCNIDTIRLVAGDASNRKYFRIEQGGKVRIVMDAPPEKGEDVRPFVRIAKWLKAAGLSAPELYEADEKAGFLLIEDLGDDLFARLLTYRRADEATLYRAATEVLLAIHHQEPPDLAPYSATKMAEMAALSAVWYLPGVTGRTDAAAAESLQLLMEDRLTSLEGTRQVLIQRDYHAENLLWLPSRQGVARVGLLDFQDAMIGHPAYDLVSVLQDARRDVSPRVQADMLAYFQSAGSHGPELSWQYHLLGLQRNLRILGVFARLCIRDGKTGYVDLIPRVWGHVVQNLHALDDTHLSKRILEVLPQPTPDRLDQIRRAQS